MAERVAARLAAQERQIEVLGEEISRLRDAVSGGCFSAELASGSELEDLRGENEKLRYRLVHLQRALRAELELELELETQGQAGARTGRESKSNAVHKKHETSARETPKVNAPQKVGPLLAVAVVVVVILCDVTSHDANIAIIAVIYLCTFSVSVRVPYKQLIQNTYIKHQHTH